MRLGPGLGTGFSVWSSDLSRSFLWVSVDLCTAAELCLGCWNAQGPHKGAFTGASARVNVPELC